MNDGKGWNTLRIENTKMKICYDVNKSEQLHFRVIKMMSTYFKFGVCFFFSLKHHYRFMGVDLEEMTLTQGET